MSADETLERNKEIKREREIKKMDNNITLAISKIVKKKQADSARANVKPGTYDIDTVVRIKGSFTVGEDFDKAATVSLLNKESMLLILKAAGVTRDSAMKAIADVAGDYLEGWDGSDECKERASEIRKERLAEYDPEGKGMKAFDSFTASLGRIPVKGSVKTKLTMEEVASVKKSDTVEVEVKKIA